MLTQDDAGNTKTKDWLLPLEPKIPENQIVTDVYHCMHPPSSAADAEGLARKKKPPATRPLPFWAENAILLAFFGRI
jgi:hypothetical protein